MINENELILNNKSYINKDFETVYKELIDIAKKISYRYDPNTSNESDVFIVLTKLLAFGVDKVNYNLDKGLLERFLLSATQEESVQDITNRLGYNMHYYIAAQTDVTITYYGNDFTKILPKYTLLGTAIDEVQYITTQEGVFGSKTINYCTVNALQCKGNIKTLSVISENQDNTLITLSNLDDNRRIYFPEPMVAQNGVFIDGGITVSKQNVDIGNAEGWTSSDNLNLENYGSLVFKFNYDSVKKLPYIEFPEWIDKIIGSGLTIRYILCDGKSGNVSAKYINSISNIPSNQSNAYTNDEADQFIVTNLSAAYNGQNPQTIDEAYEGFKKTIGTFDTLVACRDYANAIYNLLNNSGDNFVSNAQVGDRRIDINYSRNVVEYTSYGQQVVSELGTTPEIDANDLCLYPLNPVTNLTFKNLKECDGYESTFQRLKDTETLKNYLESNKYASHNYKPLQEKDIILIRNLYNLDVIIYTNYKVNILEENQILLNINNALAKNFNSRKIDYGYEIPIDLIHDTILNSDSRIKAIALNIPDHNLEALVKKDSYERGEDEVLPLNKGLDSNNYWYLDLVAKNILAGRVSCFDYDERFGFNYSQTNNVIYNDVKSITSSPFGFDDSSDHNELTKTCTSYTLKENEVIQISCPSLKDSGTVYPYPVKYMLHVENRRVGYDSATHTLKAGIYKLNTNEFIAFTYTKNKQKQFDLYGVDSIIEINNDIEVNELNPTPPTPTTPESSYDYLIQGTEVTIREVNEVNLTKNIYAYWITNKTGNEIVWNRRDLNDSSETEHYYDYILNDNEYFFYTDNTNSYLASCGSGTKLSLLSSQNTTDIKWKIDPNKSLSISDIILEGLDSIKNNFTYISIGTNNELKELDILEQDIINLTEDDQITFSNNYELTPNIFTDIDNDIEINYTLTDGINNVVATVDLGNKYKRQVRILLDINSSPEVPQLLIEDQAILIKILNDELNPIIIKNSDPSVSDTNFNFSIIEQLSGGKDIDLSYNNLEGTNIYPTLENYNQVEVQKSSSDINFTPLSENYYYLFGINSNEENPDGDITLSVPNITDEATYIMCRVEDISGTVIDEETPSPITVSIDNGTLTNLSHVGKYTLDYNTINIFKLEGNYTEIIFTKATSQGSTPTQGEAQLIISSPRIVIGQNELLDLDDSVDILNYIEAKYPYQFSKFYITNYIDKDKEIPLSSNYKLSSSQAFCNANNIANKWVLSKIDFTGDQTDIRIAPTSKLN